jgi:hypothetical protein
LPPAKGNVCVVVLGDKINYSSAKRYRWEYGEKAPGRQSIKRWLEQFQETGSALHMKGARRLSADADTVEMVREAFQCSPQMAYLQPNVFFQQDGAPPHRGLTVRESLNKIIPDGLGWTDPLTPPI